jgi:Terminase small subunit
MPNKDRKPSLTPLQRAFVREYVRSDNPFVRGHALAAYRAAGGKSKTDAAASVSASQILRKLKVQEAIDVLHIQADAELLLRLVDWKMAAIEAQPHLLALIQGILPGGDRIRNRNDAAIAQVMLGALKEVMDRGFPKSLYLRVSAKESLAKLLGVSPESLPGSLEDEA